MTTNQITNKMQELGIVWAVSASKFQAVGDDKAYYHVHPDAMHPHRNDIKRFDTLDEVASYVNARERANDAPDFDSAMKIMDEYNESVLIGW